MRLNYDRFMQIGNLFRCYPTEIQAQTLAQWIGCQRFIYNAKIQEDRYKQESDIRLLGIGFRAPRKKKQMVFNLVVKTAGLLRYP